MELSNFLKLSIIQLEVDNLDLGELKKLKVAGYKTLINQSKNVELKESVHLLQKKVAREEQKR